MRDLFGNEGQAPLAPSSSPTALSLFDAVAEQRALRTGRSKSQERAELMAAGSGYRCLKNHALRATKRGLVCVECDR